MVEIFLSPLQAGGRQKETTVTHAVGWACLDVQESGLLVDRQCLAEKCKGAVRMEVRWRLTEVNFRKAALHVGSHSGV